MRKALNGEAKRQGGVSLIPSDWAEVERVAALANIPKNQVFEAAIRHYFSCPHVSQKMVGNSQNMGIDWTAPHGE